MQECDLQRLSRWFHAYAESFYTPEAEDRMNISLKIEHTRHVRENIAEIAGEHAGSAEKTRLAEAVALLHDVGRFPQYARYGTFRDSDSVNHGRLGAGVLQEHGVLDGLPASDREVILDSVRFHNALDVPKNRGGDALLFLRLIRDADKLDIFRVFLELYAGEAKSAVHTMGLPDTPGYTEALAETVIKGGPVMLSDVGNLNDYRLLHLSWVYSLNFRATFRLLLERGHIEGLVSLLPQTEQVAEVRSRVEGFARQRLHA